MASKKDESGLSRQERQRFNRLGIEAIDEYKKAILELADEHGEGVIKKIISPEIIGPRFFKYPKLYAMAAVITMRASKDPARRATPESIFLARDIIKSTPGLNNPDGKEHTLNFATVLSHYAKESNLSPRAAKKDVQDFLRTLPVKKRLRFITRFGNVFEPVEGSFKQNKMFLGTPAERKVAVKEYHAGVKKIISRSYNYKDIEEMREKMEEWPLRKPARTWKAVRPRFVAAPRARK